MLRTMLIACALALPSMAAAQDFPSAVAGIEVTTDDGTVVGHVDHVTRDHRGRIASASAHGLAPADAPVSATDEALSRIPQYRAPDRSADAVAQAGVSDNSGQTRNTALR
ncbi:MAG: hypothetical protein ABUL73_06665 [Alphaproteobacteria bacterium]